MNKVREVVKASLDSLYRDIDHAIIAYQTEPNPYTARHLREMVLRYCTLGLIDSKTVRKVLDDLDHDARTLNSLSTKFS